MTTPSLTNPNPKRDDERVEKVPTISPEMEGAALDAFYGSQDWRVPKRTKLYEKMSRRDMQRALLAALANAPLPASARPSPADPVRAALEEAWTPGDRTDDLVDRFAVALKAKLRQSEDKRGWKDGQPSAWRHADWQERCQVALAHHVWKGDPIDVAAFAAFCWHHEWPTYAPRVHGDRKTESVVPTAAGEAAYQARYPGAPLGDCEDWAVDAWNRVATAALSVSTPTGEGEVRESLKPFVAHYQPWMDEWADDKPCTVFATVTFGDLRRARAAIGSTPSKGSL